MKRSAGFQERVEKMDAYEIIEALEKAETDRDRCADLVRRGKRRIEIGDDDCRHRFGGGQPVGKYTCDKCGEAANEVVLHANLRLAALGRELVTAETDRDKLRAALRIARHQIALRGSERMMTIKEFDDAAGIDPEAL